MNEVLKILNSELPEPFQYERIEKRLRVTFEYAIRSACDVERNRDSLRRSIKLSKEKDRMKDPLAPFGGGIPDLAELFRTKPAASQPSQPKRPPAPPQNSGPKNPPSAPTNP